MAEAYLLDVNGRAALTIALLLVLPSSAQQPTSRSESSDSLWTWSEQCGNSRKFGVTVRLDGKVLYRGVLPICRGNRNAEDGRVKFHFGGGHRFQSEHRTRSTDSIEGYIWQAGREPDALLLGISFMTKEQILLNTLHIAKTDGQTSSELDKGLFITTYSVRQLRR